MKTVGLILAGGQSGRLGEHKFQKNLGGIPLLERVASRLSLQVNCIAVNLPHDCLHDGFTVLHESESSAGQAGPLAGVLLGLKWAHSVKATALMTIPVDVPFFPNDLVDTLTTNLSGLNPACAVENGRRHGLCTLWPVACLPVFTAAFNDDGVRTVNQMLDVLGVVETAFDVGNYLKFFNINTVEDIEKAEKLLMESKGSEDS